MTDYTDPALDLFQKLWDRQHSGTETQLDQIKKAFIAFGQHCREEVEKEIAEKLQDPFAVRVNYLRGKIAMQTIIDEACEQAKAQERERCAVIAGGNYDRPGIERAIDRCPHHRFKWDACDECSAQHIRSGKP
jgi:hypothetical protein